MNNRLTDWTCEYCGLDLPDNQDPTLWYEFHLFMAHPEVLRAERPPQVVKKSPSTHMRITHQYKAKLRRLCEVSKRKPAAEIEWLIDQALLNGTQTIELKPLDSDGFKQFVDEQSRRLS